jgi:hypothetical protein
LPQLASIVKGILNLKQSQLRHAPLVHAQDALTFENASAPPVPGKGKSAAGQRMLSALTVAIEPDNFCHVYIVKISHYQRLVNYQFLPSQRITSNLRSNQASDFLTYTGERMHFASFGFVWVLAVSVSYHG